MSFDAPVKDMLFNIEHLSRWSEVAGLDKYDGLELSDAGAVLEEFGRFCAEEIAPLNASGDADASHFQDDKVQLAGGFAQAYQKFVEMGWQSLPHPSAFGGQDLPRAVAASATEMLNAANLSFALCPLLTDGAIEALLTAGSDATKATYLDNLVSGKWTGTMNLTEPQAGSDLALVRSRAEPQADGTYKVSGTKIFITYGEHDMSENIVHLVLARTPDAPAGVKGISLFLVPKFMVVDDGALGARNAVHCQSVEHKLGIKASPTAVLQFEGATGFLIGEENAGLTYMFEMMNSARYAVGLQGIAVGERAYQQALAFAKERVQSAPVDGSSRDAVTIVHHPDVRRMLMRMRVLTEGARGMAAFAAGCQDLARNAGSPEAQAEAKALSEFLTPLVKGFSTEMVSRWRPWVFRYMVAWALLKKPARRSITGMPVFCQSMKAPPPFRPMIWWGAKRCAMAVKPPVPWPHGLLRQKQSWRQAQLRPRPLRHAWQLRGRPLKRWSRICSAWIRRKCLPPLALVCPI